METLELKFKLTFQNVRESTSLTTLVTLIDF